MLDKNASTRATIKQLLNMDWAVQGSPIDVKLVEDVSPNGLGDIKR